ncbi:unnamed protein product [Rotaria magnacalcarata]|uniref:Retrotransposon gag domain-containing protein n=1 Tax=Rotaria magnacalcarata TaxID=392030 RepID=A0A820RA75_9BILA|nr:unnamed protein product [Rotaria magnacalcarata]
MELLQIWKSSLTLVFTLWCCPRYAYHGRHQMVKQKFWLGGQLEEGFVRNDCRKTFLSISFDRELKQDLLDRFKQSRSTPKTQLKERKQQPGETLIAYYDDIRDLCKQVDNNIPLNIIVDYLQDGLRHELKIHIKRQLKALNNEPTPAIFSKIACDEEELHITTPTVLPNKSRLNHSGTQDDEDLINHIYINILIDSGSSITVIHNHFLQRIHRNTFEPTRPSYI